MNTQKKITFLGGDERQITAVRRLSSCGYNVFTFACAQVEGEALNSFETLNTALNSSDIIVLPLPSSVDGASLNAPFWTGDKIYFSQITELLDFNSACRLVIGGRIPEGFAINLQSKNIQVIDYFKSEAFQIENAYTTSEAALSIAMNNLKRNIKGASFAITGYGRIARTLTELLLKLGADVCVLARKESDLAWASLAGAMPKRLNEDGIKSLTRGYDIIFNTVPTWLFFEDFLLNVDKNTLIIDLASSPGGVDVSSAKKLSSKVLWASSLPGKYAPESAGELIADCIIKIISEVEL